MAKYNVTYPRVRYTENPMYWIGKKNYHNPLWRQVNFGRKKVTRRCLLKAKRLGRIRVAPA